MVPTALHSFLTHPFGIVKRLRVGGRERQKQTESRKLVPKSFSSCKHAHLLVNSRLGAVLLVFPHGDFFSLVHLFFFL